VTIHSGAIQDTMMRNFKAKLGLGGVIGALAAAMLSSLAAAQDAKPAAPPAVSPPAGTSSGSAWNAQVAPAGGTSGIALDERQTEVVKKVGGYFATLENLKGAFVQTGADKKRMRGKFFVKRPGRFRFDYALPSKQIIISDGQYLAVQDLDINTEDRISLDQTAFRLLLRKDVDLIRDAKIIEVQSAEDLIVVALQDKSPEAPGKIKLIFTTKPALELKEWVTTDAQGLDTTIEVSELNKTDQLDVGLFKIQPVGMPKATP
jgi:outer membrane lipoprotein-sorting protein